MAEHHLQRNLSVLRIGGDLLVERPGAGRTLTLRHPPPWLFPALSRLAGAATTDAAGALRGAGVPEDSTGHVVAQLARWHILAPERGPAERDTPRVRDLQFAGSADRPDYASPQTLRQDPADMHRLAAASPPPPAFAGVPGPRLPVPLQLSRFLRLSHGILRDATIGPLPRSLRVPPSHGASHPFDLTVSRGPGGRHFYDPHAHALVRIPGPGDPGVTVRVHLAVARCQWRYRSSVAYPTLHLDLGHLIECMSYAATVVGATVRTALTDDRLRDRTEFPGQTLATARLRWDHDDPG